MTYTPASGALAAHRADCPRCGPGGVPPCRAGAILAARAAEGPPSNPVAGLLLHRLHCDQCYHALLAGQADTGSCAEGAVLMTEAAAMLAQAASRGRHHAPGARQAQPDSGDGA